jgi:hypothetical protein
MPESPQNWPFVVVFFACFLLFTAAEIFWLRRGGSDFRRIFLVASASNILAITLGFFLAFIIAGLLFATALTSNLEGQEVRQPFLWTVAGAAILFPVALLAVTKRLLLSVNGLADGIANPWIYAVVAAVLFHAFVLGIPTFLTYLT